ncbi:MAG TPA: hypothetical protein VJT49_18965 [Amycolatopsis sp.]|uniref:hypothetical protein n=1 Tax=Amycolatopsis sp. TaxID=37632 RepID=UPI002B49B718|nr:hypothetical protein [Amycolatopsis sp.]HKS47148.1 hypothetical protein [Amycolatopsis sp.]
MPVSEMITDSAVIKGSKIDSALRETELIASAGIILSSLEYLCQPSEFEGKGGLLSWELWRTRYRWASGEKAKHLDRLFKPPGVHALIGLRLAAATITVTPGVNPRAKALATAYLAVTNLVLQIRNSYGMDGSDHMNGMVYSALAVARAFPKDQRIKEIATLFIAAQSCLSYLSAGAAKLVSPFWRDGTAIQGIFRTRSFGQRHLSKLLRKYPVLATAGGWATVLGEMLFPLVMVANKPTARALLGTGTAFHIGNALFMGLNRFVWAFGATYPSIAYHAKSLG